MLNRAVASAATVNNAHTDVKTLYFAEVIQENYGLIRGLDWFDADYSSEPYTTIEEAI